MLAAESIQELRPLIALNLLGWHDRSFLESRWKCFCGLSCFFHGPLWRPLQWLHGSCLIKVEHGIKLIRQPRIKVMTLAFGFGPINDTDGPLQTRLAQH